MSTDETRKAAIRQYVWDLLLPKWLRYPMGVVYTATLAVGIAETVHDTPLLHTVGTVCSWASGLMFVFFAAQVLLVRRRFGRVSWVDVCRRSRDRVLRCARMVGGPADGGETPLTFPGWVPWPSELCPKLGGKYHHYRLNEEAPTTGPIATYIYTGECGKANCDGRGPSPHAVS